MAQFPGEMEARDRGDEPRPKKAKFENTPQMSRDDMDGDFVPRNFDNKSDCSLNESALEDYTNDLRQKLVMMYRTITLPNVSWMDNGSLLMDSYYVHLELNANRQNLALESIFDITEDNSVNSEIQSRASTSLDGFKRLRVSESDKSPDRILIEAPPGYGKTTLANKIIYDWAVQKDYVKRFKFAFLVTLRNLQQSVQKEISEIATDCGFEDSDLAEYVIGKVPEETLIILDGLDELNNKFKKDVLQVLFKKQFHSSTVIATCRTGSFELTQEEKVWLSRGFARKSQFFEKKIKILGFNETSRRTLLRNLIDREDQIRRVEEIIKPVEKLFVCPLFVILVAQIVDEDDSVIVETRTDLFKCLVDCVVRRSESKCGNELPNNFTMFDNCESFRKYRDMFYTFGKLSSKNFEQDSLQFDCNNETDEIYEKGFLIKHETKRKFSVQYHYEGFHKTILEFAIAFSMWIDYECNDRVFNTETITEIIKLFIKRRESSMILPFLCGLLGDEVSNLFNNLSPYCAIFSTSTQCIWYILAECKPVTQLADEVIKFFPPVIQFDSTVLLFNTSLSEKLLRHKIFKIEEFSTQDLQNLPNTPKMMQVDFSIGKYNSDHKTKHSFDKMNCDKVKFTFEFTPKDSHAQVVETWLQTLKSISAKTKNVTFNCWLNPVIEDHINRNILKDTPINKLTCKSIGKPVGENVVKHFITSNQLKKLKLLTSDGSCLDEVFSTISMSAYLQTLHLENLQYVVDLSKLTNNGTRRWKKIMLVDTNVACTSPLADPTCISVFGNIRCDNSPAIFNFVHSEVLHCDYKYLLDAQQSELLETGWNSLKEIILILNPDENCAKLTAYVLALRRICSPIVRIHILFGKRGKRQDIEDVLIECLKSIKVTEISLHFPSAHDVAWSKCNLSSFPDIILREQIEIQKINLINYKVILDCPQLMQSLTSSLNNGNVKEVIFCFSREDKKLFKVVRDNNLCTKYNIQHKKFKSCYVDNSDVCSSAVCISISAM